MNICTMALVLGSLLLAQAVWAQEGPVSEVKMNKDVAAVANGSNAFGVALYGQLAAKQKGNLFFSPGSIDTALAMTYAGAGGETAKQMAKTLHFDLPAAQLHPAFAALIDKLNHPAQVTEFSMEAGESKPVKVPAYALVVANALWGQKGYPFKPEFTGLVAKSYGGAMNELDFAQPEAARGVINTWVAAQTKDKIKDLIPAGTLTPATRLVLTNAIYFKSNWADKFQKNATKDAPFKISADQSVDVPMMHQQHRWGYMQNDDLQAVELPYKAHELSMVILVPKKVDGLAAVEKSLTAAKLAGWLDKLQAVKVDLTLPKWKFTSAFSLGDTLKSMGMADAFDPAKADFSGMASHEQLFIGAVIHKAFVAVDEEGTEAAAATAVAMFGAAMPRPEEPEIVKADHPFLFLIRHNATGEILFLGRVANPKD